MKWNPFKRTPETETKSVVVDLNNELSEFFRFGSTGATATSAMNLYRSSSAVSVPVNMISDAFSVIEPALQVGRDIVTEHPVLDFLKKPHPLFPRELFLQVISRDYLVTGEFSVIALGAINRPPLTLQPMSPTRLTPIQEEADAPNSWIVSGQTLAGSYSGEMNKLELRYLDGNLRELKHVRMYSTRDNSSGRGESPLVPISNEVRQHILGTSHNVSLLENGGRLSLSFNFDQDIKPDDFEKVRDDIHARFAGPKGDRMLVTAGGKLDVKELGISNRDMDYMNLNATAVKAAASQYHVPLPLVVQERQTLNNYGEAKLALYDDAVLPVGHRVLGGLSELLLPRFGLDPMSARLVPNVETVTALVMRRNRELKIRSDIGIENDNELRALIGREEYEGGDVHYKLANQVPVGSDLFTDDNERSEIEPGGGASARGKGGN